MKAFLFLFSGEWALKLAFARLGWSGRLAPCPSGFPGWTRSIVGSLLALCLTLWEALGCGGAGALGPAPPTTDTLRNLGRARG